jgi:predicted Zn-dependent protease
MRHLLPALLCLCILVFSSCKALPPVQDGGSLKREGADVYWVANDFPLLVLIDDTLPQIYVEATFEAVAEWNSDLGVTVFEPHVYDFTTPAPRMYGVVIVSIDELGESAKNDDTDVWGLHSGHFYEGSAHRQYSWVWYDYDAPDHVLKFVMVHELGHALTLGHDPGDLFSIMYPYITDVMYEAEIRPDDALRILRMVFDDPRF